MCKTGRVFRAGFGASDKGHVLFVVSVEGRREGGKAGWGARPVLTREGHGGERHGRRVIMKGKGTRWRVCVCVCRRYT